eukprot:scaffold1673_cov167-Chaetoceros_neogracile.AAC.9
MKFSLATATLLLPTTLASFERIAGYQPISQITDHNAIDLDQKSMETYLALGTEEGFQCAQNIYEQGGDSKVYAVITLSSPLVADLSKGDPIFFVDGTAISTNAYSGASAGDTVIEIKYATSDDQDTYVGCRAGALPEWDQLTSGCFGVSEIITVNGVSYTSNTYDVANDNKAGRTIQGFSTSADLEQLTTSQDCPGCPYKEFKKFYDYYGSSTYADEYVTAALDGTATSFSRGLGDADFSKYGFDGRKEGAKRGSVYLNVYMYVLREFEDAIDDCMDDEYDQNHGAAHAWDEGVAFYTGSLEGTNGAGSGKLLHALADKRCANYKTCGNDGDEVEGISKINYLLGNQFIIGQNALLTYNCGAVRPIVDRIADLMSVPMIQGTLRYAYKVDVQGGVEKEKAEGAVFMAAVIPRVHDCNPADAAIIYENMKIGAASTDHKKVKKAFERNYDCMGVNGALVGGLFNRATNAYYVGTEPKQESSFTCGSSNELAIGLGSDAAAVALVLALCVIIICGVFYILMRSGRSSLPLYGQIHPIEVK